MNAIFDLSLHLKVAGAGLILLAFAHFAIAKHLRWKEDFARVSLVNRQIFYVHCFFLMLALVLMGLLSLFYTQDLLEPSPLAWVVLVGLSVFWGVRLLFQWLVYDRSLWHGQPLNAFFHWFFTAVWSYLCAVYGLAAWEQMGL